MDDATRRREDDEALWAEALAEAQGKLRSAWLITLGVLLFIAGAAMASRGPDSGPAGLLFGVLGVGLIVTGLVGRPRR